LKSDLEPPADISMTLILNDDEFLENLYRRYYRIRVEAMIEVADLLKKSESKEAALRTLDCRVGQLIHKSTDNTADIHDMCCRFYKRGNPRREKLSI